MLIIHNLNLIFQNVTFAAIAVGDVKKQSHTLLKKKKILPVSPISIRSLMIKISESAPKSTSVSEP